MAVYYTGKIRLLSGPKKIINSATLYSQRQLKRSCCCTKTLLLPQTDRQTDRQPSSKMKVWQVKRVFERRLLSGLRYSPPPIAAHGTPEEVLLAGGTGRSPAPLRLPPAPRGPARGQDGGRDGILTAHRHLLHTYPDPFILSDLVNQGGNQRVSLTIYGNNK